MRYRETPLHDVAQTSREMYRMASAWREDMAPLASRSLPELFEILKNLPWRPDPYAAEVLQRPWYTLNRVGFGGDCDDKAIATGAYCHLHGLPFRFVAVARPGKSLHHVYTEIMIGTTWIPFDPTYKTNVLGRPMANFAKRVVLRG